MALYRKHSAALATTYADVENHALHQDDVLVGTPGSITVRQNANGSRFHVRQFYDHEGRKRDQYLTRATDTPETAALVDGWRGRIEEEKSVRSSVRLLAREGFCTLAPKHLAALAPLGRHRAFEAGAVLVGTHAFEIIVNRLGIRVAVFATEDVDIARPRKLAIEGLPKGGLLELLRESGIDFVGVPPLERSKPATSFKERGRSRFTFDLLVPAAGERMEVHPVPELEAHATALPYLRYLLGATQTGAAISTHGVLAVRVPVPERFALNKLMVAELRTGRPEKSLKDLKQAAVLIAALGENHPGALEEGFRSAPVSTRKYLRSAARRIRESLAPHPQAWEELAALVKP